MPVENNLLERAKPELLKAIAVCEIDYPGTAKYVKDELSNNFGVSYLTYGVLCDIRSMCIAAKMEFDLNNPWKLFNDYKK